jgi:head-tail adaptor
MTREVVLNRRLALQGLETAPDGSGGFAVSWRTLGMIWADIRAVASREDFAGGRARPRVRYRILVRAAPEGAPSRPRSDQRLREAGRIFDILTVAEHGADGRYLEIVAEEGVEA